MRNTMLFAMVISVLLAAEANALKAQAPASRPVVELVKKLGDDNFKVREQAQADLMKIGEPARDELLKAAASDDPELKAGAASVLAEIAKTRLVANSQGVLDKVCWSFKQENLVAGPAPAGGMLWVLTGEGKLLGINPDTGQSALEAQASAPPAGIGPCFFSSAGDRLLLGRDDGSLCAFDGKTGKLDWKSQEAAATAPATPKAAPNAAVIVGVKVRQLDRPQTVFAASADAVACWKEGTLTVLSVKEGNKLWSAAVSEVRCPPCMADGKLLVACVSDGSPEPALTAFNAADGKVLWRSAAQTTDKALYCNGAVILASGGQLRAFNAADGKKLWEKTVGESKPRQVPGLTGVRTLGMNGKTLVMGSTLLQVAVGEDVIYAADSETLAALKGKDGSLLWKSKFPADPDDSPADSAESLIAMGADGRTSPARSTQRGFRFDDPPAIGKEAIWVPDFDGIYAFDRKSGSPLWFLKLDRQLQGAFMLKDSRLFFAAGYPSTPLSAPAGGGAVGPKPPEQPKPPLPAGLHALKDLAKSSPPNQSAQ